MNDETQNIWDWPAFGYVSGEMSDEERRLFEQRLANDEAACDAVAQAVELREAVRLASREPFVERRTTKSVGLRRGFAWAAAIAACLVPAYAVWQFASVTPRQHGESAESMEQRRPTPNKVESGVSLAWAELQNSDADHMNDDSVLSFLDTAATASQPDSAQFDTVIAEIGDVTVPQWMMTAVSSGNVQAKEIP